MWLFISIIITWLGCTYYIHTHKKRIAINKVLIVKGLVFGSKHKDKKGRKYKVVFDKEYLVKPYQFIESITIGKQKMTISDVSVTDFNGNRKNIDLEFNLYVKDIYKLCDNLYPLTDTDIKNLLIEVVSYKHLKREIAKYPFEEIKIDNLEYYLGESIKRELDKYGIHSSDFKLSELYVKSTENEKDMNEDEHERNLENEKKRKTASEIIIIGG